MATRTIVESPGITRRKRLDETYVGEWLMTTDHKKIGLMYIITGFLLLSGWRYGGSAHSYPIGSAQW